jgi:transposase
MIPITPNMRLFVAIDPVDGRKGIDGLVHLCRSRLSCDPMEDGALVVVRNRSAKSIRLLAYDGQGWWLAQKRLSTGKFKFWPEAGDSSNPARRQLLAHELQTLIWGGDPERSHAAPMWRRIPVERPAAHAN